MHEALFYTTFKNQQVECNLCPWNCILSPGQTGNCKIRSNQDGKLITQVYNKVAALGVDPIEKKPLYHFHPAKNILSVGEVGCNLHCNFCQNHRISQCFAETFSGFSNISSKKIVKEALKTWNNLGIAYTYNEPFTFYEFMFETAKLAHENGLKNVVVSNGYVNPEPLEKILPFIHSFNIDLKAFSNDFYQTQTRGKLEPVLQTLKIIAKSAAHLEITNLIIPGLNDSEKEFREMILWIAENCGKETPLHLSRYFPKYKSKLPPTPLKTLEKLYSIAKEKLHFVYLGNVSDTIRSSTFCPICETLLIERNSYKTQIVNINSENACKNCGTKINFLNFES